MYQRVREYIRKNNMIKSGMTVIAGVSGGGDSMVMLDMLNRYRQECDFGLKAVHIHHGIRGEEADRDLAFVEEICTKWNIPFCAYRYDVPTLSAQCAKGLEETARMVRREAFARERAFFLEQQVRTALAHHQGDLAETMLHHLARGTGLKGLSSMRPASGGVIRPLLCLEREEVERYRLERELPCVTDSTNFSDAYTRNRIRHHILPLLKTEVNERAVSHMAEAALRLAQAEDYLQKKARELYKACECDNGVFFLDEDFFGREGILQAYALQDMYEKLTGSRRDFTARHVQEVLGLWEKQSGRQIQLPKRVTAVRQYGGVFLGKEQPGPQKKEEQTEYLLRIPGKTATGLGDFCGEIILRRQEKIAEKKYTKWFDYDKIVDNLCVRTRRPGDYMVIDSHGSKKKLSRIMIDDKIPKALREEIPLVTAGSEVLWLVGGRINERFKITSQTKRVFVLHYQGGKDHE